jgi:quercetin dioxygenase-like cupin family protein
MIANSRIGRASWIGGRAARTLALGLAVGLGFGFVCGRLGQAREGDAVATQLLASGETVVGEAIAYPTGSPAKVTAAVLTLAPGASTGWHTHGIPTFGYILEGELTVDYGAKGVRVYRAGDALLEAIHIAHDGRNTGAGPMRILAVFMGADGLPTSAPAPGP